MTLEEVASNPASATFSLNTPAGAILSPLHQSDESELFAFFDGLSSRTRKFFSVTDPRADASSRCLAIARYDKLRLVLRSSGHILALVEFSFDLGPTDAERFARHGVTLRPGHDCRWGLCISDEWQGRGVGTALAAASFDLARRFNRDRVILWGGVHVANETAFRYYRRVGFTEVGPFTNDAGIFSLDMIRALELIGA